MKGGEANCLGEEEDVQELEDGEASSVEGSPGHIIQGELVGVIDAKVDAL